MAGEKGKGTMPFKWAGPTKKDTYGGQRPPMPNPTKGRVLYSSKNKRIGRQEGTGPES